jgi:nitrogen fixation NifU-like protein
MSTDLNALYQEVILDHYRNPRGAGEVDKPTHSAFANNPLCGDEILITVRVAGGVIEEVKHRSIGCAICVASASMMAESVVGKTTEGFSAVSKNFYAFARGENNNVEGKLAAFAGVSKFPMRVKCATLAWHTLENALNK